MSSQLRKRNWNTISVIALIGLLFLVAVFAANNTVSRPFDPESSEPDGLLLLRQWLEEMGYDAQMEQQSSFHLSDQEQSLLLIYQGTLEYTEDEAEQLYQWVAAGNSAAFFLQSPVDDVLSKRFGFGLSSWNTSSRTKVAQPLIADRTDYEEPSFFPADSLDLEDAQPAVKVIASEDGASHIAVQKIGDGTVWFFSPAFSFVNQQLSESANAAQFVPLLRTIGQGAIVQLDTYHLFGNPLGDTAEITSVRGWIFYTAWGNATLFAALILGLYLLLQGRRLGPALPTQESLRRREAAEYVVAMANLYRRGKVTADVAAYQKHRLKQTLGRPLHLSADLEDAAFVQLLQAHDPRFDRINAEKVAQLLQSLDQADESRLINSAAEVDQLIRQVRG